MQRFFKEDLNSNSNVIFLDGEEKTHIIKSLRMEIGGKLIVCDGKLNDYVCKIEDFEKDKVVLTVLKKQKNENELTVLKKQKNENEADVKIHLFQAVPKLNKLEFIVQKAVELGVFKITPILTNRCIAKISEKNLEKKLKRLQKISKQAAAQSGRGIIPFVDSVLKFDTALEKIKKSELKLLFYEYATQKLNNINIKDKKNIAIVVGCEGGFEKEEVLKAKEKGVLILSLGKRILRCETAPICALSVLMNISGNL